MNENEITVVVKGASKVGKLCDLLHDTQAAAVTNNSNLIRQNITITLLPGLTLTCSYITSFSVSAISPMQIDSHGRVVNAEVTIKYLDAQ